MSVIVPETGRVLSPSYFVVALDIGGGSVKSGVFSLSGELLSTPETTLIESQGSASRIFDTIAGVIQRELTAVPEAECWRLVVGFPGPFDYARGVCWIRGVEKYDAIFGHDVGAALLNRLPRPPAVIHFINDALAAIVGEAVAGAGRGFTRVLGITLGSGLGSAFLIAGKPVVHAAGVPEGGWLYPCQFEGVPADEKFSTRGLRLRASAAGFDNDDAPALAAKARAGDEVARAVWGGFGADLGRFLSPHARAFGADMVLILGGLSRALPLFNSALQLEVGHLKLCSGQLGARAALEGLKFLSTKSRQGQDEAA